MPTYEKLGLTQLPTPNRKTGYIIEDLPKEFYPLMDEYINTKQTEIASDTLAGHLSLSCLIDHEEDKVQKLNEYIINLCLNLDIFLEGTIDDLKMTSFWVNYQKKYDFNPIHFHSSDYSFVIWYKIPYFIEDEKTVFYHTPYYERQNGTFAFHFEEEKYVSTLNLPVDKTWEKRICVFPSQLQHSVLPFYTSDEYRITFAGNLSALGQ